MPDVCHGLRGRGSLSCPRPATGGRPALTPLCRGDRLVQLCLCGPCSQSGLGDSPVRTGGAATAAHPGHPGELWMERAGDGACAEAQGEAGPRPASRARRTPLCSGAAGAAACERFLLSSLHGNREGARTWPSAARGRLEERPEDSSSSSRHHGARPAAPGRVPPVPSSRLSWVAAEDTAAEAKPRAHASQLAHWGLLGGGHLRGAPAWPWRCLHTHLNVDGVDQGLVATTGHSSHQWDAKERCGCPGLWESQESEDTVHPGSMLSQSAFSVVRNHEQVEMASPRALNAQCSEPLPQGGVGREATGVDCRQAGGSRAQGCLWPGPVWAPTGSSVPCTDCPRPAATGRLSRWPRRLLLSADWLFVVPARIPTSVHFCSVEK